LATICIDCTDAHAMADFYGRLLGWDVTFREENWRCCATRPAARACRSKATRLSSTNLAGTTRGQDKMLHLDIKVGRSRSRDRSRARIGGPAREASAAGARARAARSGRPSLLPVPRLSRRRRSRPLQVRYRDGERGDHVTESGDRSERGAVERDRGTPELDRDGLVAGVWTCSMAISAICDERVVATTTV